MKINVIPYPNHIEERSGYFVLRCDASVYFDKAAGVYGERVIEVMQELFQDFKGGLTKNKASASIRLETDPSLLEEAYIIDINEASLSLKASSDAGFIYALSTFLQLIETGQKNKTSEMVFECMTVKDGPRYKWRGFLFDESRHFFGEKEVKRLLDLMSVHKLNKFIWHLSDDQGFRIESFAFPKLTEISTARADTQIGGWTSKKYRGIGHSGYYTQAQIKEIVGYAKARNIEIIPEISLPGHFSAILAAYPELSCTEESISVRNKFGSFDLIACAGKQEVYDFLFKLIDEVSSLFPSAYFHIGGEGYSIEKWSECPHCKARMEENKLEKLKDLEVYMLNRVASHIKSIGKTPLVRNTALGQNTDKGILADYYIKTEYEPLAEFVENGGKYVCSRHGYYYLDHPYALNPLQKVYRYDPASDDLQGLPEELRQNAVQGITACLWTEWVYDREKIDFNVFPRLSAVAETAWTEKANKNYKSFVSRLKAFARQMKGFDVNFAKVRIAECRNPVTRVRELTRWALSDQYSEVRKNRQQ